MESFHAIGMERRFAQFLLLALLHLEGLDVSQGYNLEISAVRTFSNPGDLFGYRAKQFNATEGARVLVGDPASGHLYKCDVTNGSCDVIAPPSNSTRFGLTLEVDPISTQCIVCGIGDPHDCDRVLYMNGACFKLNSDLTVTEELRPGYRDCQKAEVDLCFLIDGSSGMGITEIKAIVSFMNNTMRSHNASKINFAAVQFATFPRTEFNFNKYEKIRDPNVLLQNFTKMSGLTSAYEAIQHALNEVFTDKAGARPHAKKVILMLTDGDITDTDKNNSILMQSETRRVSRYIVGLGKNFGNVDSKKKLDALASDPAESHVKVLEDVSQLEDLFAEIKRKIVSVEGVSNSSNFPREFSSAGLSADVLQETLVLGDPGIYEWSGGILEVLPEQETLLNTSVEQDRHFAYLGYSVRLIPTPDGLFCLSGAPRYNYRGQVVLLRKYSDIPGWEERTKLQGEQFGSYFGSEIAVSDHNKDGTSHLVLISAPHYLEKRWGGQVSVCLFVKGNLSCSLTLRGEPGHPFAQFGAAVTVLSDLDGDGIGEVAVGAPYEQDGRGALYIFKGETMGVQSSYSQRLSGTSGSRCFGLSVHGVLDLSGDGLTDVVVGALGQVFVHRSRPMINVTLNMKFKPQEFPIPDSDTAGCESGMSMQVCVHTRILTRVYTGSLDLLLQYSLVLDSGRSSSRVSFENHKRELNGTLTVKREDEDCHNISVFLSDFSLDDVSPIGVYLVVHQKDCLWLLSPSSRLAAVSQVPFRLCENGGICGSDVSVKFKEGDRFVLTKKAKYSVKLELKNMGEVGHQITLTLTYPDGLSFHKASIEFLRREHLSCSAMEPQRVTCNVTNAKLRHGKSAVIHVMFDVLLNVTWPDTVYIKAQVSSINETEDTLSDNSETLEIPVLRSISVIAKELDKSTKYVTFSKLDHRHILSHVYQIKNLEVGGFPVHVKVRVRVQHSQPDGLLWDEPVVFMDPHRPCDPAAPIVSGQREFLCFVKNLNETNINVTGILRATKAWKNPVSVFINSSVIIHYNESQYHSDTDTFHETQIQTSVDLLVTPNYLLHIIGSSVGGTVLLLLICGILYKCGFFTRYKDRMSDAKMSKQDAGTEGPDAREGMDMAEDKELQAQLSPEGSF